MEFTHRLSPRAALAGCTTAWFLLAVPLTHAQDFRLESVGARGGFSENDRTDDFRQAEAFVNWNLPWHWDLGADWGLQTKLELSAGLLGGPTPGAAPGTGGASPVPSPEK